MLEMIGFLVALDRTSSRQIAFNTHESISVYDERHFYSRIFIISYS